MRRIVLIMFMFAALNAGAATNSVPANVSQPVTNMAAKVAAKTKRGKASERPQCEAITKSGKRCSRKAAPGEKLCRQHLKARNRSTE